MDRIILQSGGSDIEAQELKEKIRTSQNQVKLQGTVYYVSEFGDDTNDGLTESTPICSINHFPKKRDLILKMLSFAE